MAVVVAYTLHTMKYFLLVPALIRYMETFTDGLVGHLLLSIFSFNNIREQYNREHKNYDFVKM